MAALLSVTETQVRYRIARATRDQIQVLLDILLQRNGLVNPHTLTVVDIFTTNSFACYLLSC